MYVCIFQIIQMRDVVVVKNQSEPTQILIDPEVLYIHASTRSSSNMRSRYYIMNVVR